MSEEKAKVAAEKTILLPTPESEEAMRTYLADKWRNTIAPHELGRQVNKNDKKMDPQMTIVTASAVPKGAFDATLMDPKSQRQVLQTQNFMSDTHRMLSDTKPQGMQTIPLAIETQRPQSAADLPRTMLHPSATSPTSAATDLTVRADTTPSGTGEPTPSQRARTSTIAETGTDPTKSGTSAAVRSATAGALVRAAQALASASITRMVVQTKTVVDATQSANTLMLRKIQPDYEIRSVLGEGGMGMVYTARQTSIDREIALKMIKPKMAQNRDVQTVFLAEAAVTGELEHPNIIPIYELGIQENGVLFYSMRKAIGVEWKSVIAKKSLEENIEILMKVADAIAFAHSKGIVHRDIKPENVMLGEFGEVLVMDWGLAASVVEGGKIGRISEANAAGGTPAYMAPEMCTGQVDLIGYQSDVYLLGAILYEIVTGKRPHYAKNMMDLLYNIATNKIEPTEKKGELINIALRAMSTHPKDRHPSAKDFQKAVRDTLKHNESIALATTAQKDLEKAQESGNYDLYAQALFGYQEAARLWDGNLAAKEGVSQTRLAYAQRAIVKEDLDLAASLASPLKEQYPDLGEEVARLIKARDARRLRLKILTYASAALVAIFLIGMTGAYFAVQAEKNAAEAAKEDAVLSEKKAQLQKKEAEEQREVAHTQRSKAETALEEAERQRRQAEQARSETEQQRQKAVASAEEAQKQRQEALAAKEDADKQRKEALSAKEDAERQRGQALKAKEDAEEQRKQALAAKEDADKQRQIAEQRFLDLQKIGGLKKRLQESLAPEAAQALQTKAAQGQQKESFWKVPLGQQQLELALIPAGEFVMGSDIDEKFRASEEYLHAVKLSKPLYMGRHEFTQGQWAEVMGQPPAKEYDPVRDANKPMVDLSYTQLVQELLPQLQRFAPAGYLFRLPTEAEWEFACRAGSYRPYNAGLEDKVDTFAWYQDNSNKSLQLVGQKAPNAWGLFDMHGNASEICQDLHDPNFYLNSPEMDPLSSSGKFRVVRGGSWINLPQHLRSAYRSYVHPENKYDHLGCRLVLAQK